MTEISKAAQVANIGTGIVSVTDFGAVGDGVTDDGPAINLALDYIRSLLDDSVTTKLNGLKIVFPPGDYLIQTTLNFTGIKSAGFVADFSGAFLIGQTNGKPVIDLMGSRYWHFMNLYIHGDDTLTPNFGVIHGRMTDTVSAGDAQFTNCNIIGEYTVASLYNLASETISYFSCKFWNEHQTGATKCVYMDGDNTFDISSDYTNVTIPVGTKQSFNENGFYTCDIRNTNIVGTPSCIYISGKSSRHGFIQCYAANFGGPIVETYNIPDCVDWNLDIHVEVDLGGGNGVTEFLLVDNVTPGVSINLAGLKIRDQNAQCTTSLIDTTGSTYPLLLDGINIELSDTTNAIPIYGGTLVPSKVLASGVIRWSGNQSLDLSNMYFNGTIYTKSTTTVIDGFGSYDIVRRPQDSGSRIKELKGACRFWGESDGVDLSNYVEVKGAAAGGLPRIATGGSDTDIDLQLIAKGSGLVRLGTHSTIGAETVTGYITIKDESGVERKIAVVS